MLQCCQIQRFTDSLLFQHIHRQQFIRCRIRYDLTIAHYNDPIHITIKSIFQTMLYDNNCYILVFLNVVDQINCSLTCSRVQIRQWFVKKQNIHIINHDSCHGYTLFLSAGQFPWGMM